MAITGLLMVLVGGGSIFPSQLFFPGKPKQNLNSEQITQICQILKTSGEETARMQAIDDLRLIVGISQHLAVSALMDSLKMDRKSGVRAEAAVALSKMRPIRQEVGTALENSIAKDTSMRVRIQARSALLQYNLAGYRSTQGSIPIADPLGQIAKEPSTQTLPAKSSWNWLLSPFSMGEQLTSDQSASATTEQPNSWPRPGKAMLGWFQGVMGFPETPPKDKIQNQANGILGANVPMPQRLPAQISFPVVPEFSPVTKPNSEPELTGPELGNPKP
jgi:hypothetical protein